MPVKKDINKENVLEAMKLLMEHKQDSYPKLADALEKKGFTWSVQDVKYWMEDNHIEGETLGPGLEHGDLAQGATFVANAFSNENGWSYCQEWLFDASDQPCVGSWIKAAEQPVKSHDVFKDPVLRSRDPVLHFRDPVLRLDETRRFNGGDIRSFMSEESVGLTFDGDFDGTSVGIVPFKPLGVAVGPRISDKLSGMTVGLSRDMINQIGNDIESDDMQLSVVMLREPMLSESDFVICNVQEMDGTDVCIVSSDIAKEFENGDFDGDSYRLTSANDPQFLIKLTSIAAMSSDEKVQRKLSNELNWSLHAKSAKENKPYVETLPYLELKPEKHLAKVAVSKDADKLGISSKDGVAYIKYVQRVHTGNSDSPSEIIPLIQDGRIFCSVLPFHSENGDRVVLEYNAKDILDDIRTQTLTNDVFLQRIKKRKEEASAARLAKVEAEFGDYNFDESSTTPSSLGPILE